MNGFTRVLGILGIAIATTGCALPRAIDRTNEILGKVQAGVSRVEAEVKKADADGDGVVTGEEWLKYLAGGGAVGLLALAKRLMGSTKEKQLVLEKQEQTNEQMRIQILELAKKLPPDAPTA